MATDASPSKPTDIVRELPPASDQGPGLSLPACTLHPSREAAVQEAAGSIKSITPVEQFLRVLLLQNGESAVPDTVASFTQDQWEQEAQHFRSESDWAAWKSRVGPYMTGQLEDIEDAESELRANRKRWLLDQIPSELDRHVEKAHEIRSAVRNHSHYGWEAALVLPSGTPPSDYDGPSPADMTIMSESALDNEVLPSEIGLELPAPLVVGTFPSSSKGDSTYCLLPYCGTVVCGGPYFHSRGHTVLCKHLVYTLLEAHQQRGNTLGLVPLSNSEHVPDRVRQLIAPEALEQYHPSSY
jgi:hypothetical protein